MSIKRTSYTAEFKLRVVQKAEELGNRPAGRLFNIHEKSIRMWRKNKDVLAKAKKNQRAVNRGQKASWPQLEDKLLQWIIIERNAGVVLSTRDIRIKSQTMAEEMCIEPFLGGIGWFSRFMKRKNLVCTDGILYDENLPSDWEKKAEMFLKFVEKSVKRLNCDTCDIFALDEVLLSYDPVKCYMNATVPHQKGKFNFSVTLGCSASGIKLKPMIVFKKNSINVRQFSEGVLVEVSNNGTASANNMILWLDVFSKHCKETSNRVLILDFKKSHILYQMEGIPENVLADMLVIPEGMTKKLLPLQFGITKSFKSFIKLLCYKQMTEGINSNKTSGSICDENDCNVSSSRVCDEDHSYETYRRLCDSTVLAILSCVEEAWSRISAHKIKNAFIEAGLSKEKAAVDKKELLDDKMLELFSSDSDCSEFDGFV